MVETKANDVLELGRARALLGCSSTMSLLDGVRAATSTIIEMRAEMDHLRERLRLASGEDGDGDEDG
jgi:hypothetical protein